MTVKFTLSIGYGARSEEVELDDDLTDEDIEDQYQSWVQCYLDGGWTKL